MPGASSRPWWRCSGGCCCHGGQRRVLPGGAGRHCLRRGGRRLRDGGAGHPCRRGAHPKPAGRTPSRSPGVSCLAVCHLRGGCRVATVPGVLSSAAAPDRPAMASTSNATANRWLAGASTAALLLTSSGAGRNRRPVMISLALRCRLSPRIDRIASWSGRGLPRLGGWQPDRCDAAPLATIPPTPRGTLPPVDHDRNRGHLGGVDRLLEAPSGCRDAVPRGVEQVHDLPELVDGAVGGVRM